MSVSILQNVRLFGAGCDFTGVNNKAELSVDIDAQDVTTFAETGTPWKSFIGGIKSWKVTASGFWEAGDASTVDDVLWDEIGGTGVWSLCPDGAAVDALAYPLNALTTKRMHLGEVGSVAPWDAELAGNGITARGVVAHPPGTARTATGSGTALQVGAVAAGRRMVAALHVLSVSGTDTPTLTVEVESDNADTMGSTVAQLTFAGATAVGGQFLQTVGSAITDDWWRVSWTISGTNPSFLFLVTLGIT